MERIKEGSFTLADTGLAATTKGLEPDVEADQATQDQLREVVVQKVESQHRKDDVLLDYAAKQVAATSNRTQTSTPPVKQSEAEAEAESQGHAQLATHATAPPNAQPQQAKERTQAAKKESANAAAKRVTSQQHLPSPAAVTNVSALDSHHSTTSSPAPSVHLSTSNLAGRNKASTEHEDDELVSKFVPSASHSSVGTGAARANAPLSPPPRPVQNRYTDHYESKLILAPTSLESAFSNRANTPGMRQLPNTTSSTSGLWPGKPAGESISRPSRPRNRTVDEGNRTASWSIWLRLNKDETDLMSAAELSQAISLGGHTTSNEQTTNMLIRMFDVERSGTINFEDFCGIWQYITAWSKLFDRVKGPTGKVSLSEFEDALVAFGFRLSPEFARILFDTCTGIGNGPDGRLAVSSYAVLAQNFTPGTTVADIEERLTASSIDFLEPALIREGEAIVSVEMTFKSEHDAKKAVDSFHGCEWLCIGKYDIIQRSESNRSVWYERDIDACQVISFEGFVHAFARLKQMTDVFKKHDDDRDGYITLGFEEFLTDVFGLLLREYIEEG